MDARERFQAIMHFEPGVRTLKWEFGYWNAAIDRWYEEGLPRSPYSPPFGQAAGGAHYGEGLPFPYYLGTFRYRDIDVHQIFGLEEGAVNIPLNWRFSPPLRERVLEEDQYTRLLVNTDGVTLRQRKDSDSIPQFIDWPVKDRRTWKRVKEEHFRLDLSGRFPNRWESASRTYTPREYPLGVRMEGFFSIPRELIGVEKLLMMYYDDPVLLHDIAETLADLWLAMLEEVVSKVELDFIHIWEDMAFKNGPLISPRLFREFLTPYYKRITGFLHAHGVDIIFVDTDGNCWKLIEPFLEAGVTGLFPFEVNSGMDVVEVRQKFPRLLIQRGLDKLKIAEGKDAIDAELDSRIMPMLQAGGYIPFMDHLVPPDVSWENFCYYRTRLNALIDQYFQM